jgi:hypothetical protein
MSPEFVHEVETCPLCEHRNLRAVVTYYEDYGWFESETTGGIVRQRDESNEGVVCSNPNCERYDRHAAEFIRHILHGHRFT